mmetsp:Transcript_2917/g.8798  ORF Transcript_2917/g.8798 Transcript_2917/m.8798 type:complete len:128 (-) Transcript_2917:291-674(-)
MCISLARRPRWGAGSGRNSIHGASRECHAKIHLAKIVRTATARSIGTSSKQQQRCGWPATMMRVRASLALSAAALGEHKEQAARERRCAVQPSKQASESLPATARSATHEALALEARWQKDGQAQSS